MPAFSFNFRSLDLSCFTRVSGGTLCRVIRRNGNLGGAESFDYVKTRYNIFLEVIGLHSIRFPLLTARRFAEFSDIVNVCNLLCRALYTLFRFVSIARHVLTL